MDELLQEFINETRETLEALSGEIVAWEASPDDRARLDSIFRFVHTVKGNCGFFDFPRLEALSHAAEDALAEVRAEGDDRAMGGPGGARLARLHPLGQPTAHARDRRTVTATSPNGTGMGAAGLCTVTATV